ncbi:MAG TPA: hypothetical protein VM262_06545 [Acidimicrobiales bacterium]|nr:hypothetical protein [Acidimicrobiales bacterium]
MTLRSRWIRVAAGLLVGSLALTACGDDDDDGAAGDDTTTTAAGGDDAAATVEVTLIDYGFQGLPASIEAGTQLTVRNDSEAEMHELVAVLLPDDEERSVSELLSLPEEEIGALLGGGEPAAVLLATPGSDETIPAVGDGTLTEPGRYLIACFIPQGADPDEFMAAAAESEGGPPEVEGGPPHFVLGMQAELRVE